MPLRLVGAASEVVKRTAVNIKERMLILNPKPVGSEVTRILLTSMKQICLRVSRKQTIKQEKQRRKERNKGKDSEKCAKR